MSHGAYVIAIDVGIKNLGVCIYSFHTNKIVHWDNVNLVPNNGRYIPAQNVHYVRSFCANLEHYFTNCFMLLIERQIRCNMRIIESVLQSMFYDKCIIICARSVKVHYGLSTRNYRLNKQKAVEWACRFIATNPYVFEPGVQTRFGHGKQDDLADSLLLLMYYLDTYSNQLSSK